MNVSWKEKWRGVFAPPDVPGTAAPSGTDESESTIVNEEVPPTGEEGEKPAEGEEAPAEGEKPAEEEKPAGEEPAAGAAESPVTRMVPQARADELVAQRWAERRAREQAEARASLAEEQLRQLQALANGEDPATPKTPAAKTGLSVEEQVAAGVRETLFTEKCNRVAASGKTAHADFDESLGALRTAAGGALPRALAEVALEVGGESGAAELLYMLGKDSSKADEILSKPPLQMALALTKIHDGLKRPKSTSVSGAPVPIKPAVGTGGNAAPKGKVEDGGKIPYEDWLAAREKEVEAEEKRKRRA